MFPRALRTACRARNGPPRVWQKRLRLGVGSLRRERGTPVLLEKRLRSPLNSHISLAEGDIDRRHQIKLLTMVGLSGVWVLAGAGAAMAGTGDLIIDKIAFFNQTSSSPPATAVEWKFSATVLPANPIDIAAAELTPPGGSPLAIGPGASGAVRQLHVASPVGRGLPRRRIRFSDNLRQLVRRHGLADDARQQFLPRRDSGPQRFLVYCLGDIQPVASLAAEPGLLHSHVRTTFPFVDFWIWDMSNQTTFLYRGHVDECLQLYLSDHPRVDVTPEPSILGQLRVRK